MKESKSKRCGNKTELERSVSNKKCSEGTLIWAPATRIIHGGLEFGIKNELLKEKETTAAVDQKAIKLDTEHIYIERDGNEWDENEILKEYPPAITDFCFPSEEDRVTFAEFEHAHMNVEQFVIHVISRAQAWKQIRMERDNQDRQLFIRVRKCCQTARLCKTPEEAKKLLFTMFQRHGFKPKDAYDKFMTGVCDQRRPEPHTFAQTVESVEIFTCKTQAPAKNEDLDLFMQQLTFWPKSLRYIIATYCIDTFGNLLRSWLLRQNIHLFTWDRTTIELEVRLIQEHSVYLCLRGRPDHCECVYKISFIEYWAYWKEIDQTNFWHNYFHNSDLLLENFMVQVRSRIRQQSQSQSQSQSHSSNQTVQIVPRLWTFVS